MVRIRRVTHSEEAQLKQRLVGALPASRFEMETFSRLADIVVTRQVPSAAVECRMKPRLLINPDFVSQHCHTDEHLFMLVMHELMHVQMAHTRMYPRMNRLQNIALDAIINATLLREFADERYQSFFKALYPADSFPGCLLRPPDGWPYNPAYPDSAGPAGTGSLIQSLYPPGNLPFYAMPLYEDVLTLLLQGGLSFDEEGVFLLGGHDGAATTHDPLMRDFMKQITEKWAILPGFSTGSSRFGHRRFPVSDATTEMRAVFARTLRRTLNHSPGRQRHKERLPLEVIGGTGVLPNPHDRLMAARRQLGLTQTLYAQPLQVKARQPEKPVRSFIYLDVSGSMNHYLPYLLGLIVPYVATNRAEVFQFSTVIKPLTLADLRQGRTTTSGGTSINPVFRHLIGSAPLPRRVLLLTDGEVGTPRAELVEQFTQLGIQLYVVLPHEGQLNPQIAALATSTVRLPRH